MMTVKAILEQKGHQVVTLGPNEKLAVAIQMLKLEYEGFEIDGDVQEPAES